MHSRGKESERRSKPLVLVKLIDQEAPHAQSLFTVMAVIIDRIREEDKSQHTFEFSGIYGSYSIDRGAQVTLDLRVVKKS